MNRRISTLEAGLGGTAIATLICLFIFIYYGPEILASTKTDIREERQLLIDRATRICSPDFTSYVVREPRRTRECIALGAAAIAASTDVSEQQQARARIIYIRAARAVVERDSLAAERLIHRADSLVRAL